MSFIYYGDILRFMEEKVLFKELFRSKKKAELHRIKILNMLSDCASETLNRTLWNYLGFVNVAEEDRRYIKAKSEFLYRRILVTFAKKSYIGWLIRQEAVVFDKPKFDVKGISFFKSTTSEKTAQFIYDDLLRDQLFEPKDGQVSLRRIYKTIAKFNTTIREEIAHGDMGYLKRSIKVKSPDAYADPMRIGQYKAVYTWNALTEDKEQIRLPATTTLVKVKLKTKKDVAALAPWPDKYAKAMALFEKNPDFGDHLEYIVDEKGNHLKDKDGNIRTKLVKGKGVNAIAMPNELDEVPDWLIAIIDVNQLATDNMALLAGLMKPLGFSAGNVTVGGSAATYYTSIIRI